jgi:hypothetical protein
MASSGKKKTTMAKLARETRLRERRLNKQARKDARRQASSDQLDSPEVALEATNTDRIQPAPEQAALDPGEEQPEQGDGSTKDIALQRLREAPDEELALFEGALRQDALAAGASEQELRKAQSGHPGHG